MYQPFEAITSDFTNPSLTVTKRDSAIDGHPMMCIRYGTHKEEIAVITKQQAMEFFGLVDPHEVPAQGSDVPWWNVMYLADNDQIVSFHTNVQATDYENAIYEARKELGEDAFIISIIKEDFALNKDQVK